MPTPSDTPDFLKTGAPSTFSGRKKRWILLAATICAVAVIGLFFAGGNGTSGSYLTEEAAIGKLVVSISASGTLQPTRSVDVGSELSGTLEAVLANENDRVTKGQIVARLDTAKLRDSVAKSKAAVDAAEASVAQADATLGESRANLDRLRQVAETTPNPSVSHLARLPVQA